MKDATKIFSLEIKKIISENQIDLFLLNNLQKKTFKIKKNDSSINHSLKIFYTHTQKKKKDKGRKKRNYEIEISLLKARIFYFMFFPCTIMKMFRSFDGIVVAKNLIVVTFFKLSKYDT